MNDPPQAKSPADKTAGKQAPNPKETSRTNQQESKQQCFVTLSADRI